MDTVIEGNSSYSYGYHYKLFGTDDECRDLRALLLTASKERGYWDNIDNVLEFIRLFKVTFKNFNSFINHQLNNDEESLKNRVIDCILDTHCYLNGEPRKLEVTNWYSLIVNGGDYAKPKAARLALSKVNFPAFESMVTTWCSKPDGFSDMVCTVAIFILDGEEYNSGRPLNDSRLSFTF